MSTSPAFPSLQTQPRSSGELRVSGCSTDPVVTRRVVVWAVYLYIAILHVNIRFCRRQGLPDCHGAGTSVRRERRMGFVILDVEADRRSRRRGERREFRPGRSSCRRRPGPCIRAGDRRQPWIIGLTPHPGRRPCRERRNGADRHCAVVNGCPVTSVSLSGVTRSDEGGRGERAQCRRSALEQSLRYRLLETRRTGRYVRQRRLGAGASGAVQIG
jgi:hypothetical protein